MSVMDVRREVESREKIKLRVIGVWVKPEASIFGVFQQVNCVRNGEGNDIF